MSIVNLYRSYTVTQLLTYLRLKGITIRHLAFGSAIALFLWTSYYTFFFRQSLDLRQIYVHSTTTPEGWRNRAEQVKAAFVHAYHGYEKHAWKWDELRPMTDKGQNNLNGWGLTIIDSLDTMYLMNLHDEFDRAVSFVNGSDFRQPAGIYTPFFETVIRYLGGLLSAYTLSREPILLARADDLGRLLAPAFSTNSGFPAFGVSTFSGAQTGGTLGVLAEIASCQLEYTYLAKETGKKQYFDLANKIVKTLNRGNFTDVGGMSPIQWNITKGAPFDYHLSVGAQADSAHEYLLKQYLLTAKTDRRSLEMYIRATTHILTNLFYLSPTRHFLYVTDAIGAGHSARPSHTLEHLSCFLPGLLALGAHTLPLTNLASIGINLNELAKDLNAESKADYAKLSEYNLRDVHLWAAEGLAQACYLTYADQPSGLSPDEIVVYATPDRSKPHLRVSGGWRWFDTLEEWKRSGSRGAPPGLTPMSAAIYSEEDRMKGPVKGAPLRDYAVKKTRYLLRPETLESFYILHRVTGNSRWREHGWTIFESIIKESQTASGFANIRNVQYSPAIQEDDMPSYFLAETLKYLYLMFTDEDLIPLDKYVFNTEGHPFAIFEWTEEEKQEWNIS